MNNYENTEKINNQTLYDLYVNQGKTIKEIAKEYKSDRKLLSKRLKEMNVFIKKTGGYTAEDLTDKQFGCFKVLERDKNPELVSSKKYISPHWLCLCTRCNNKIVSVRIDRL